MSNFQFNSASTDRYQDEIHSLAIVVRTWPYRDSDLMVHLLTPSRGKISVLARQARNSKKRFPNGVDIFDRGVVTLKQKRGGRFSLENFTPSRSLLSLRNDLNKLSLASLLCESCDRLLLEDDTQSSTETFELLDLSLNAINEAQNLKDALRPTYLALSFIAKECGIIDLSGENIGSKSLIRVMDAIENFTERPLATRSSVAGVIDGLKKKGV